MKEIKWVIGSGEVSDKVIRGLENYWSIKFPELYINVVTKHNGAQPDVKDKNDEWKPGIIYIPEWRSKVTSFMFLKYTNTDNIEKMSAVKTYNAYIGCLPEPNKIFPFAMNGGGDIFYFDYRKNQDEPSIVFLDHNMAYEEEDFTEEELEEKSLYELLDENLYPVCNSFKEFLDLIYPDED